MYHNSDDGNSQFSINHFEQPGFLPNWDDHRILNNVFNSQQRPIRAASAIFNSPFQFRLNNSSSSYRFNTVSLLDEDWFPEPDSTAIDSGILVDGINEDFEGIGPDVGCLEIGQTKWEYGAPALPPW